MTFIVQSGTPKKPFLIHAHVAEKSPPSFGQTLDLDFKIFHSSLKKILMLQCAHQHEIAYDQNKLMGWFCSFYTSNLEVACRFLELVKART
jgi:hypothetical protein